jgi:hypothetical protein
MMRTCVDLPARLPARNANRSDRTVVERSVELGDHTRGVSLRFWNLTKAPTTSGTVSWFEFIDFRRDIVVGSPFSRHQFLQKASPKITLRGFHQPSHQIFWQSVESIFRRQGRPSLKSRNSGLEMIAAVQSSQT